MFGFILGAIAGPAIMAAVVIVLAEAHSGPDLGDPHGPL